MSFSVTGDVYLKYPSHSLKLLRQQKKKFYELEGNEKVFWGQIQQIPCPLEFWFGRKLCENEKCYQDENCLHGIMQAQEMNLATFWATDRTSF